MHRLEFSGNETNTKLMLKAHWASKVEGRLNRLMDNMQFRNESEAVQEMSQRIGALFLNKGYDLTLCQFTDQGVMIHIPDSKKETVKITLRVERGVFGVTMQFPDLCYPWVAPMAAKAVYNYGLGLHPVKIDHEKYDSLNWICINAACALHFSGIDWRLFYDGWVDNEFEFRDYRSL
jgi:hypothetical protein